MFAKRSRAVDVHDPRSDLAPFEVTTADPRWVPVPVRYPTPTDRTAWDWMRRSAADHAPGGRAGKDSAPFSLMSTDVNNRYAGHDAYWGLLSEDSLPNATYLMLWFDVADAAVESSTALLARLTADRYDGWGTPALGYIAVPAGPPVVRPVDAARLGSGTCVVRRDLSELRTVDKHGHAANPAVQPGEDVRSWPYGMSLHWVFEDAGTVLHAGVDAGGVGALVVIEALHRALPQFWQLLDSIGRPGRRAGGVDTAARVEVADEISTMIAERRDEEARLAHHHLWNRR